MIRAVTLIFLLLAFSPTASLAQQADGRAPTVNQARDVALALCARPTDYGFSKNASGSFRGDLQFNKLLKVIASSSGSVKVSGDVSSYSGVLREHLAFAQAAYNKCVDSVYNATLHHLRISPANNGIPPAAPASRPGTPRPKHVMIISDELGSDQMFERIGVYIEGKFFGDLFVDRKNRNSAIILRAPKGSYHYRISGSEGWMEKGVLKSREMKSSGIIDLMGDAELYVGYDSDEKLALLVK